ncbi:hypothetical protein [Luteolibacter marinus]|uniref:hypothetical protein n=1 Tax=Luteolibacter marinus TaxID=2776705 RepID=UPI001868C1E9|nr:hypothetical protein [Luteolibacter marinus]
MKPALPPEGPSFLSRLFPRRARRRGLLAIPAIAMSGLLAPHLEAGEVYLDFTTNAAIHATGWTPVPAPGGLANLVDAGGSGYDFTFGVAGVPVGAYDNGNSGQPLTRSGFHNQASDIARTFTLTGLDVGQAVDLYACAAWDLGAGGYIVFGDTGPAGVKAETIGDPGSTPTRANLTRIGQAIADATGTVSGELHSRNGVGLTGGEGQVGGFVFAPAETITSSAGANGSISPAGAVPVIAGDDQLFTITPQSGFHTVDVLVDGVSVGAVASYTFGDVQGEHTISATFAANTFTHVITASAGANGTIDPVGSVATYDGVNQPFFITPDEGYHIDQVLVDGSPVGAVESYIFTAVSGNHTISASFAVDTFTVTATAGPNGSIDPSGETVVDSGESLFFTITPDEGYYVAEVLVDGMSVGTDEFLPLDNITADHTISVTFDNRPRIYLDFAGNSFGWNSVFLTGGSVSEPDIDGAGHGFTFSNVGSYDNGNTSQSLTRSGFHNQNNYVTPHPFTLTGLIPGQPVQLYACAAWNEGQGAYIVYGDTGAAGVKAETIGDPGNSPTLAHLKYIGTASADAGGVVSGSMHGAGGVGTGPEGQIGGFVFIIEEAPVWTITASAGANGTISPSGGVGVASGEDQSFTITANGGYHIADVLVDGVTVGAVSEYTFSTVTANHSISATFEADGASFTISTDAGANGSITPGGDVVVNQGINKVFTITPDLGHHIVDVLVDGVSIGAVTSHTFTNVTANHTISATFAVDTFTINASAIGNGTISPVGVTPVNYGDSPEFIFTPDPGYLVDEVFVDGVLVETGGSYTFSNVTGNHEISVRFDNRTKLKLDFTQFGSPNADLWIPVYGNQIADTNVDLPDVGGTGYSLTFSHVACWDNGAVGQPLTRSGFYNYGQDANDHTFTLRGLNAGQTVALYACAGWDGNAKGGYVLFGDNGPDGVKAQTVGDPGTSPSIANMTLIGTAVSDATGTVSGSLHSDVGVGLPGEGQVGAFMFAFSADGTPPVLTPFQEWAASFGLFGADALADADPDHDGLSNELEFGLNSFPNDGSSRGLVFARMATVGAEDGVLTLTVACRNGAVFSADGNKQVSAMVDGIVYTIEAANDLTDWGGPVVTEVTGSDATDIHDQLPFPDSEWTYRTFRTDGSSASDSSDFIRVGVD